MPDKPASHASAYAKDGGSYAPLIGFLRRYERGDFQRDLVAGLIVAAISVPQAVAYAFWLGCRPRRGCTLAWRRWFCTPFWVHRAI